MRTVVLNISDDLYRQLKRAAELLHQPPEAIVVLSLAHTLPPVLEEIPSQYQEAVLPLLQMDDAELQSEMARVFPPQLWSEYEVLLGKKKTDALTVAEEKRLQALRNEADVHMLRRGYAAVLLKRGRYIDRRADAHRARHGQCPVSQQRTANVRASYLG